MNGGNTSLLENNKDFIVMDELSYDGCWFDSTSNGSNFWQPGLSCSSSSNFSSSYVPSSETNFNPNPYQIYFEEDETEMKPPRDNALIDYTSMDKCSGNPTPMTSVEKRLMQAIEYLKEFSKDRCVLIQIWLPVKRGAKHVLTTDNQLFFLNPNCKDLANYRDISRSYQFAAEEDSKELIGLPGRVFLKKFPVCTSDIRLEYPRMNYAQMFHVSGSLDLPVFERGSGTCLGVVEIVTTAQKVNYRPELEIVCKALEAVDLRSSDFLIPPKLKDCNESYQAALIEIRDVLKSVCDTHNLPLAQTWSPCTQQGKVGCQQSDGNYAACISIIDAACYVFDPQVLGFYEVCSEKHLLRGEGVAGGALVSNQPCFATDITAFSRSEYPLADDAKMFKLRGAVAIRLRSIYTGPTDFILEFFLPPDCKDDEEQKHMLSSLSTVIQQIFRSLRVVTDEELAEETPFLVKETNFAPLENARDESSWISHMLEAQQKGTGVFVSMGCQKEEPEEEFKVINQWTNIESGFYHGQAFSEPEKKFQPDLGLNGSVEGQRDFSSGRGNRSLGARKSGEKRKAKTERNISLQALRQYFPGSLKDAAKSIGVCPTTLKRICRQHGITRWPSRKIKKVGHSLRKLQLVIDSVHGTEGAIQLGSFYTNFPELNSPPSKPNNDRVTLLKTQSLCSLLSPGTTQISHSSSSGSLSSGSSLCFSTGAKEPPPVSTTTLGGGIALPTKKAGGGMGQEETPPKKLLVRSQSCLEVLPPLVKSGGFRVKATYGEEKIRLSLPEHWGFGDLQREIARRFNIDDISFITLKYLDDDNEWVLLTCDADLEECMDLHKSSRNQTIKLFLHQAFQSNVGSFGSSFNSNSLS